MSDDDQDAVTGENQQARRGDLTQGPIMRTLVAFSVPMLASNVLQTMGQTINTVWVGQLLGDKALAATANAAMVVFLAFALVFGFGMATTVKVGQYYGGHDIDGARRTFGTGTGFCAILATVGGVLGWLFAGGLLHVLGTPESVHDAALAYLKISFLAMPFTTFSMMVSMGLRGVGDARTPLYAMILTAILGIVLNPLLILGLGGLPRLGIAGSALANTIATIAGAIVMVGWAYWRDLPLRLRGREFGYLIPGGEELNYVLAKGVPMGAQMLLSSGASLIFIGLVNREGVLTAAAYGALLQVWNYIQMPAFTISMAVSAMVAQSIGAAKHDRVGEITRVGVITNTVATLGLALLLIVFDAPLFGLFLGAHSGAIPIAAHIQLIATWSWVIQGIGMVLSGTLRAYGVVMLPLVILVIALYPARFGFYFLGYPELGADALWWAYPFGSAISLVLSWWLYKSGGWRRQQLMPSTLAPAE